MRVKYHVICDIFVKHYFHAVCKCIKWVLCCFVPGREWRLFSLENRRLSANELIKMHIKKHSWTLCSTFCHFVSSQMQPIAQGFKCAPEHLLQCVPSMLIVFYLQWCFFHRFGNCSGRWKRQTIQGLVLRDLSGILEIMRICILACVLCVFVSAFA